MLLFQAPDKALGRCTGCYRAASDMALTSMKYELISSTIWYP